MTHFFCAGGYGSFGGAEEELQTADEVGCSAEDGDKADDYGDNQKEQGVLVLTRWFLARASVPDGGLSLEVCFDPRLRLSPK